MKACYLCVNQRFRMVASVSLSKKCSRLASNATRMTVAGTGGGARVNAGDDVVVLAGGLEVQIGLRAHQLNHFHVDSMTESGDGSGTLLRRGYSQDGCP